MPAHGGGMEISMKKIFGLLLSITMIFLSAAAVGAESAGSIELDDIGFDIQSGTVFVTGNLKEGMGLRKVSILAVRGDTDLSSLADGNASSIQNTAEVRTDYFGKFTYRFEVNYNEVDNAERLDVYASFVNTGETVKKTLEFPGEVFWKSMKDSSLILNEQNKNVYINGERQLTANVPYLYGNSVYVDLKTVGEYLKAETAVSENEFSMSWDNHIITGNINSAEVLIDGTTYEFMPSLKNSGSAYVDINIFEKTGKRIYTGEKVFIISDKEISANPDIFAPVFGLYVSRDGSDTADGSAANPVRTINKAISLADRNRGFEGCTIYIGKGRYFENVTIENKKDITIENYADERVVITGGIRLDNDDFSVVSDSEVLQRFGKEASGKLLQLDLSKYLSEMKSPRSVLGADGYYRLYNGSGKQTLARYPNAEYAVVRMVNEDDPEEGYYIEGTDRVKQWQDISGLYMSSYISAPYNMHKSNVAETDKETGIFKLTKNVKISEVGINAALYNVSEELDIPGEWYIDRTEKKLYYYPTDNMETMTLTVSDNALISLKGSENISIKNIEIGESNGNGIYAEQCKNVAVDGVKLHSVGGIGVMFTDCTDSAVKNSEIFDTVKGAAHINGGVVLTLTPGNSGVENCHIYDYSEENTYKAGITLEGMGNYAKHNTIHDSMSQGVYIIGNGHTVENNEIYNVVRDTYDAGAIYGIVAGENIGNKILNNYIHDVTKSYRNWGKVHGIYMDNMSSGTVFSNNIVADCTSGGLYGGGRDNDITNNIFLDCKIEYDNRGVFGGWFRINGKYWDLPIVNEEGYDAERWYSVYPMWKGMVEDYAKEKAWFEDPDNNPKFDAGIPRNAVIEDNVLIQRDKQLDTLNPVNTWWKASNPDYNTSYMRKLGIDKTKYPNYEEWFKDLENRDFTQIEGSQLFDELPTFNRIDFDAIGNSEYLYGGTASPTLKIPENNRTTGSKVEFIWEKTSGASEYVLCISKNSDMSDPIYEETVNTNTKTAELESGRYYYTVTARNLSKMYKSESVSKISTFRVKSEISLESVTVQENESSSEAVFVYGSGNGIPNGKIVLAEKTSDGKLVNVTVKDIFGDDNGKITVNGSFEKGNVLECYLCEDLNTFELYCGKTVAKK